MRLTRVLSRVVALSMVLIVPVAAAAGSKKAAKPENAAALVGGVAIAFDDLEQAASARLTRVRNDEYNVRRAVLEEMITTQLIAQEAARRGITSEELLKVEVDGKVAAINAADVEPFYEGTKERYGGLSKEEAINDILAGMRRSKSTQRMTEFVNELRRGAEIRVLIDPPRTKIDVAGQVRGNPNAPVTIVEFSDYECPFCGRAAATIKKIVDTYGDSVRVVFLDFPLPIHRGAPRAAEAAYCAGDQGKFWEMSDLLFTKGGAIHDGDIRKYAGELKLDRDTFEQCLGSGRHKQTWMNAQAEGKRIGVQSTPTFFVNGRMLSGAVPFDAFARVVDEELERTGAVRPAKTAPSTVVSSK